MRTLLFLANLGFANIAAAQESYVAIIGVSDYPYLEDVPRLTSVKEDCRKLDIFFTATAHLPDENVFSICGTNATRDNIVDLLLEATVTIQSGDHLSIFWMGHGASDNSAGYLAFMAADARSTVIDINPGFIKSSDVLKIIEDRTPGSNVLLVTNTSHSGSFGKLNLNGPIAASFPAIDGFATLSASVPQRIEDEAKFANAVKYCWNPENWSPNKPMTGRLVANCFEHKMDTAIGAVNIWGQILPLTSSNDKTGAMSLTAVRRSQRQYSKTLDTISIISLSAFSLSTVANATLIANGVSLRRKLEDPMVSYSTQEAFEADLKEYNQIRTLSYVLYGVMAVGLPTGVLTFQPNLNGIAVKGRF